MVKINYFTINSVTVYPIGALIYLHLQDTSWYIALTLPSNKFNINGGPSYDSCS